MPFGKEYWPASKVRDTFIKFFVEKKNHLYVPSSSVVPHDDDTLLFTNSGMNQFKPIFLGQVTPGSEMERIREHGTAVNSQKCIRAGGKHNDLDDVGKDTYHHTYFEMLGNWSFGRYFKELAIDMSWELLTEVFELEKENLYATYFEGSPEDGLEPDIEAKNLWLRYLPESRILPGDKKDNFWQMGFTGCCGPCSELHYDKIGNRNAAHLVNMDDDKVIEIWNIVFMQYNLEVDGSLTTLPDKHVDTGMGFERLVAILQDKNSNYDTDVFTPIFDKIQELSGCAPYGGKLGDEDVSGIDTAYRVIADHIRLMVFSITDGGRPGPEKADYVIRVVARRAIRFASQFLKVKPGFLRDLVDVVVDSNIDAFPELGPKREEVKEVVGQEEAAFALTLERGMKLFEKDASEAENATGDLHKVITGEKAFFLYNTMGFPFSLTQIMAEERGLTVDKEGFEQEVEKAKAISRDAAKKVRDAAASSLVLQADQTSFLKRAGVEKTVDDAKYVVDEKPTAKVKAIYIGSTNFVESTSEIKDKDAPVGLVLDRTSFYAEQGGQTSDTGTVEGEGFCLDVSSVALYGEFALHRGRFTGEISVGDKVRTCVDYEKRRLITPNHTFTHVLNLALWKILGDKVNQRGSEVDAQKLRFDFSHNSQVTPAEIKDIEKICQDYVETGRPVYAETVDLNKASEINSLRAVFGEKYPNPVRVVSIGAEVPKLMADPKSEEWNDYSIEFCGGTHLKNTAEAEAFEILEETSTSVGVRRIVAVTKDIARNARKEGETLLSKTTEAESAADEELSSILKELKSESVKNLIPLSVKTELNDRLNKLRKKNAAHLKKKAKNSLEEATQRAKAQASKYLEEGKKKLVMYEKDLAGETKLMSKLGTGLLKGDFKDMALMVISVTPDGDTVKFTAASGREEFPAHKWVQAIAEKVEGKGGGAWKSANGTGTIKSEEEAKALVAIAEEIVLNV